MNLKPDRIISIATLLAALIAIVLVLRKPAPVASPQAPAVIVQQPPAVDHASAQPQQMQSQQIQSQPTQQPASPSGVSDTAAATVATPARSTTPATTGSNSDSNSPQGNSDAINAALAQMLGGAAGTAALSPDSNVGNGAPVIKDQQVTMDGDLVHGRFLTEIAGKEVWVTISGHMGEKDGYATFDPTEFKVGDMDVPVSLVNPALQRKLAEQHDRLKITGNGAQ